jgi:hypothetical protein
MGDTGDILAVLNPHTEIVVSAVRIKFSLNDQFDEPLLRHCP